MTRFIFTITGGRTGTHWMSEFLRSNLSVPSFHERLEIDDFGVQMPDIRTLRSFNTYGMNDFVQAFWARKFDALQSLDAYVETNHTLAKCGLVEYAAEHRAADSFVFLCLRRNRFDQCVSYVSRNDFGNVTMLWQWLLHPAYSRKIVEPEPLLKLGALGPVVWYVLEVEARQAYYRQLYRDRFQFIDLELEQVTSPAGAAALLSALGHEGEPVLRERSNSSIDRVPEATKRRLAAILQAISFDPEAIAQNYITQGLRLSATANKA